MIFNNIKDTSDKNVILFQGDSWVHQINRFKSIHPMLKKTFKFHKIINAGTASYSPSLIDVQYKVMEKILRLSPNILIIYIDQTDMGDEICRYKNLAKFDTSGNLESVGMEEFPLYKGVFNLHENNLFRNRNEKQINLLKLNFILIIK